MMSGSIIEPPQRRIVVVVSDRDRLAAAANTGLVDLKASGRPGTGLAATPRLEPSELPEEYHRVVERARRFLDQTVPYDEITLVTAGTLDEVPTRWTEACTTGPAVLTLLVIDHPDHHYSTLAAGVIEEHLAKLAALLPKDVVFDPSPATVQVYTKPDKAFLSVERFAPRWTPARSWVVAADIVCAFTDSVQMHQTRRLRVDETSNALGAVLADFLDARAGATWGLHYYTGSVVAALIEHLEERAAAHGNPVVRGPSEHSLACSALARWTLDRAPFVIVVTSGMVDEFRGTLANLVAARARGFLVCADSRADQWHPFQGTIHLAEDSRAVVAARDIPTVHLDRADTLADDLRDAFDHYERDRGPVLLFATREVLQAPGVVEMLASPARSKVESVQSDGVDDLVQLLNAAPRRLLGQVGPVDAAQHELVLRLAREAGIGLVDSLTDPGTVSRYHRGKVQPEYLGTLSLYGYSARVHQFLHHDGRLRPTEDQALLFLNTRLAEIDTPFSARTMRGLAPVQITEHASDVAPFAGLGIAGPVEEILREVVRRVDVDSAVLADRRAAIESTQDSFSDVVGLLPILPMTPNYFFRNFSAMLTRLIREHDYRYIGVYDVGRAGLSAVCGLPRTGRGYSGWFGRALMGDALQALPGVATGRDENILAFVGDGAAALVPDIVPSLVQQFAVDRQRWRRNLSVFRFVNGTHSVIRTYREGRSLAAVGSQTGVLSFAEDDWDRHFGDLVVSHRMVTAFDAQYFADRLRRPAAIDLYTVLLGHNNEGDGLSLVSAYGWQRDELSARALTFSGAPSVRQAATK